MTLVEVLTKSEKPIKRKSWADYLTEQTCPCKSGGGQKPHAVGGCAEPALMFPDYVDAKLTVGDILADDWEVEPDAEG